ncbi:YpdA family putative bacillithiol disulfide reductase [Bacillus shivajii]|uniref:YpdA family putative bacillithiol disulfide reductase n=1 Tax=Bacillus shivajii TaxID=1983719 RepID=UPI001CFC2939|nr:YpdA family putative bacillithiol disulfide reductase [Bacillus shivajii]UCZ54746.1 YpdA family putative bacillithiol disulfide reductase [Bacillus shivajii]
MQQEEVIIIGGGPCGLSAAIFLQEHGINPLIIEKGNIVNAIYHYPTHQQFFSTSEKLAIGNVPFYSTERKPKRNEALVYYREVAKEKGLNIHAYEKVTSVKKQEDGTMVVSSEKAGKEKREYKASHIIVATGYYDSPNMMGIKGEELPHVFHYFKEAHPFYNQEVAIIGGKNSAVDAALELEKVGANVSVFYRGSEYSKSIKPWILPEFDGLVRKGHINMYFDTNVIEIKKDKMLIEQKGKSFEKEVDFVFAMTGYRPDHSFIESMGVEIDYTTGRPYFSKDTMETNVENIYIAGVIAAGNNANEIFIENGRWHGQLIAQSIEKKKNR